MSNRESRTSNVLPRKSSAIPASPVCDFEDIARIRRAAKNLLREIERITDKQSDEDDVVGLPERLRRYEIDLIKTALLHTGGNQSRAAKLLQIGATTLHEKIKRFGIDVF